MMTRPTCLALLAMTLLLASAGLAAAQPSLAPVTGAFTGHVGTASGTEGEGTTLSGGFSVAVVEQSGWGAEFDAGFADDDNGRTGGLNLQSYVLNLIAVYPHRRLRPFGVVGAGAIHARSCSVSCPGVAAWDWAYSLGGGLHYLRSETFGLRGDVRYFSTLGDHPDPRRADGVAFWRVSIGATFLWVAD